MLGCAADCPLAIASPRQLSFVHNQLNIIIIVFLFTKICNFLKIYSFIVNAHSH